MKKTYIDITGLDPIQAATKALEHVFGDNTYSVETDNYGQIVIYTGLKENDDGTIRQMIDEDFDEEIDEE